MNTAWVSNWYTYTLQSCMATLPSNSMLDYFHLKLIICYSRLAYSFLLQLHFYKSKTLKKASDTKLQHNYVVLLGNGFLMKNSGNEATFVCAPPLVCTVCYWYKAMAEKLQWVLSIRWRRGSSLITAGWWWGGSLSNLSDSWETLCHILSLSRGHPHRHLFCTTEGGNQACEISAL